MDKYDVAVSFAWTDEAAALNLKNALEPPLSVFVSSKAQEKLAGRDGNEAFRTVFREQAQLVVILYRPPWGETPWTRVEKMAIEEMTLEKGWERLMFVRLDKSPVPKWVPKPHLYLDYTVYTLADLVGAVKTRLIELDVEIKTISPADRASAIARQRTFDEETERRLSNSAQDFLDAQELLFSAIREEAALIAQQSGWPVAVGEGALIGGFVVSAEGQGLQIVPQNLYANQAREACLWIREYDKNLTVAQLGMRYIMTEGLDILKTTKLQIRRLSELEWCWELEGRVYPPKGAARAVVGILLDRIERSSR
jgi:hypothetical protein